MSRKSLSPVLEPGLGARLGSRGWVPGSTVVAIPAQARLSCYPGLSPQPSSAEAGAGESSEAAHAAAAAQTGELLEHSSSYYIGITVKIHKHKYKYK